MGIAAICLRFVMLVLVIQFALSAPPSKNLSRNRKPEQNVPHLRNPAVVVRQERQHWGGGNGGGYGGGGYGGGGYGGGGYGGGGYGGGHHHWGK